MSLPDLKRKKLLARLYRRYNRRSYVSPDPLECLYRFDEVKDREVAALIAACLAYGRVARIVKSVSAVLNVMGPSPHDFICSGTPARFEKEFAGFRHRFADDVHLAALLAEIQQVLLTYGSLNACFVEGLRKKDPTVIPALSVFVDRLNADAGGIGHLLADPRKGSACKRLNLFLRWMVRKDSVDPGGWTGISRAKLVVPLDTHMHAIGLALGLTRRQQADCVTAIEMTQGFACFSPRDPVKYDFALTRFGIRQEMKVDDLIRMADRAQTGKAGHGSVRIGTTLM